MGAGPSRVRRLPMGKPGATSERGAGREIRLAIAGVAQAQGDSSL